MAPNPCCPIRDSRLFPEDGQVVTTWTTWTVEGTREEQCWRVSIASGTLISRWTQNKNKHLGCQSSIQSFRYYIFREKLLTQQHFTITVRDPWLQTKALRNDSQKVLENERGNLFQNKEQQVDSVWNAKCHILQQKCFPTFYMLEKNESIANINILLYASIDGCLNASLSYNYSLKH